MLDVHRARAVSLVWMVDASQTLPCRGVCRRPRRLWIVWSHKRRVCCCRRRWVLYTLTNIYSACKWVFCECVGLIAELNAEITFELNPTKKNKPINRAQKYNHYFIYLSRSNFGSRVEGGDRSNGIWCTVVGVVVRAAPSTVPLTRKHKHRIFRRSFVIKKMYTLSSTNTKNTQPVVLLYTIYMFGWLFFCRRFRFECVCGVVWLMRSSSSSGSTVSSKIRPFATQQRTSTYTIYKYICIYFRLPATTTATVKRQQQHQSNTFNAQPSIQLSSAYKHRNQNMN